MGQSGMNIKIDLKERSLYLYADNKLYGSYRIAVGKPSTPSPVGNWTIANKSILAGGTVYGTRWMGLNTDNYGIHGNNNPSSIGKAVSLGCIRMYNEDIEKIFSLLPLHTPVEISSGAYGSGYTLPTYQPKPDNTENHKHLPNTGKKIYVIKKGDTLWSIANGNKIPLETLISLNPQLNPNLIYPGHLVYLP